MWINWTDGGVTYIEKKKEAGNLNNLKAARVKNATGPSSPQILLPIHY